MKLLVVFTMLVSSIVCQALELHKKVYRIDDLDEARRVAAEDEKPLCFMYSDIKLRPK
ncbi:hypothetical protein [Rubritalea tangerina]|uniref:Uncharacterized protein n=1 Tax=Rubritalea tangerina TaxID=430798 RepID=A0ABW4ZC46_9BACT